MIALGALIKAAGKKLTPKFATGTTFAPGGMALVGERGPELVNLPRGSQVIPSGRTSNLVGAMQSVEVYGMLRGQDIYFSNKKYSQTYNRQT
jgi:phage-related tail protein